MQQHLAQVQHRSYTRTVTLYVVLQILKNITTMDKLHMSYAVQPKLRTIITKPVSTNQHVELLSYLYRCVANLLR